MLNSTYLKFILFVSVTLGINSFTFSQEKPKSELDFSRVVRSQHHRLSTRTIDIINSNRPGFSVSPYNVGKGNFQIESGLMGYSELLGINGINGDIRSIGLDINLRYAINNKVEIYSDFNTKQGWYHTDSSSKSNFSMLPALLGLSYRFNEGEKYIPTMAIRGSIIYYKNYQEDSNTDISLTFTTQHELAINWVFITNWKVDRIITDTNLGAVISLTNTISPDWSWFVEYYLSYTSNGLDNYANAGLAYLISDDIQLDFFGGTNLDINKTTYYLSVGISWRLDRKKDRRKYNPPNGSERIDKRVYEKYKNKGIR